ncbi:uncharacterized protein ACO6RY_05298 [Pungitius sinensis]
MTSSGTADHDKRFGEACKPFCNGDNGLSEDLQGGETPQAVTVGSNVEPETEVRHHKEEQPGERHR